MLIASRGLSPESMKKWRQVPSGRLVLVEGLHRNFVVVFVVGDLLLADLLLQQVVEEGVLAGGHQGVVVLVDKMCIRDRNGLGAERLLNPIKLRMPDNRIRESDSVR